MRSIFTFLAATALISSCGLAQTKETWRQDQLLAPAELAKIISDPAKAKPIIFSVGPGGCIPGTVEMKPAGEQENLDRLRATLSKLDKNAEVVIYCGCCPYEHCPNVRPAFSLLNEMGFKNHKLLDLPHNFRTDWISKNYPMTE